MYPSLNDNVSLLLIFSSDCFSPLSPNMICTTFRKLSSCGFESSSVSRLNEYFWRSTGLLVSGPFSYLKRQQPWQFHPLKKTRKSVDPNRLHCDPEKDSMLSPYLILYPWYIASRCLLFLLWFRAIWIKHFEGVYFGPEIKHGYPFSSYSNTSLCISLYLTPCLGVKPLAYQVQV